MNVQPLQVKAGQVWTKEYAEGYFVSVQILFVNSNEIDSIIVCSDIPERSVAMLLIALLEGIEPTAYKAKYGWYLEHDSDFLGLEEEEKILNDEVFVERQSSTKI